MFEKQKAITSYPLNQIILPLMQTIIIQILYSTLQGQRTSQSARSPLGIRTRNDKIGRKEEVKQVEHHYKVIILWIQHSLEIQALHLTLSLVKNKL